jgi:putative FmdB family regulatory protein
MPIHDIQCSECNHIWEEILFKSSDEIPPCPKCGGEGDKKISTSGVSFRLYGEGFYKRTHKDTGEFA